MTCTVHRSCCTTPALKAQSPAHRHLRYTVTRTECTLVQPVARVDAPLGHALGHIDRLSDKNWSPEQFFDLLRSAGPRTEARRRRGTGGEMFPAGIGFCCPHLQYSPETQERCVQHPSERAYQPSHRAAQMLKSRPGRFAQELLLY